MRNDLTANLTAVLGKNETAPVQLLKLEWPATQALTARELYLADRALTLGSTSWRAVISRWGAVDLPGAGVASLKVNALNTLQDYGNGNQRLSDVFQVYPPEQAIATLYQWFEGESLTESDLAILLTGRVSDPVSWNATECEFHVAGHSEHYKRKTVGHAISQSEYPNAPEASIGRIKPIVLGDVKNVPAVLVRKINKTVLTSVALPGSSTLTVASTEEFSNAGTLALNDDVVTYSSKTATQFTGCTGVNDFHYADDEVLEKVSDHRYLFSDPLYPIQSISNVRVDGQPVGLFDYSVDLSRGEVVFHSKPQRVRSIDTRFLQAQFDAVAEGNTALDPDFAHQPSLRTSYARIAQTNPKLHLKQTDIMPDLGKIGRVLLRVDHFMEEKLSNDSVTVSLSGIGQVGTLSPPASDDAAQVAGSTDITHDTLDSFQFPINIPTPVITATTDGERTIRQRADTLGSNLGISDGSDLAFPNPITLNFPAAPSGASHAEYEFVMRAHSQTFNSQQGNPAFSFLGRTVSQWDPSLNNSVGEWRYFSTFKVSGGSHPTSAVLSLSNGFARVDLLLVQRILYYPATATASQESQDTLKEGGNLTTSGSRALTATTEKSTQAVTDFFDITNHVNSDWNWFSQREVEVDYAGTSDGRTAFILHVAFEIEYARRRLSATDAVTADVQGVIDDATGSVTGVAQSLIERPDHVFKWSLLHLLGLGLSDLDTASFDNAGTRLEAAVASGYRLAGVIQNSMTLDRLWDEWSKASRTRLHWDHAGRAVLNWLRVNNTLNIEGEEVKTITDDSLLLNNGRTGLEISKTPLAEVGNPVSVYYKRDWRESRSDVAFLSLVSQTDALAAATQGTGVPDRKLLIDWCSNEDQANDLVAFYLAEFSRSNTRVQVPLLNRHMDLEAGDIVKLNFPDWNISNVFSRLEASRKIIGSVEENMIDHLEFDFRLFPIAALIEALAERIEGTETFDLLAGFFVSQPESVRAQEHTTVAGTLVFQQMLDAFDSISVEGTNLFSEILEVTSFLRALDQPVLSDSVTLNDRALVDAPGYGVQAFGISGFGGKEVLA